LIDIVVVVVGCFVGFVWLGFVPLVSIVGSNLGSGAGLLASFLGCPNFGAAVLVFETVIAATESVGLGSGRTAVVVATARFSGILAVDGDSIFPLALSEGASFGTSLLDECTLCVGGFSPSIFGLRQTPWLNLQSWRVLCFFFGTSFLLSLFSFVSMTRTVGIVGQKRQRNEIIEQLMAFGAFATSRTCRSPYNPVV
jgi:hypothetical protein